VAVICEFIYVHTLRFTCLWIFSNFKRCSTLMHVLSETNTSHTLIILLSVIVCQVITQSIRRRLRYIEPLNWLHHKLTTTCTTNWCLVTKVSENARIQDVGLWRHTFEFTRREIKWKIGDRDEAYRGLNHHLCRSMQFDGRIRWTFDIITPSFELLEG
jgi:hypothetical protein